MHLLYVEEVEPNVPCHMECCAKYIFVIWNVVPNIFSTDPCTNVMDGQLENALLRLVPDSTSVDGGIALTLSPLS